MFEERLKQVLLQFNWLQVWVNVVAIETMFKNLNWIFAIVTWIENVAWKFTFNTINLHIISGKTSSTFLNRNCIL